MQSKYELSDGHIYVQRPFFARIRRNKNAIYENLHDDFSKIPWSNKLILKFHKYYIYVPQFSHGWHIKNEISNVEQTSCLKQKNDDK